MEAHRITLDEVRRRLDSGQDLLFIDSRSPRDWAAADRMIPGAVRIPADLIGNHLDRLPHDGPIVLYCS